MTSLFCIRKTDIRDILSTLLRYLYNILSILFFKIIIRVLAYCFLKIWHFWNPLFIVPFDPSKVKEDENDKITLALVKDVLKMPVTYYLGMFTLGYYLIRCIIPSVNPHLSASFGISVTFATAFTMTARTGIKMFSGPLGGRLETK